ncbi:hypothetical protein JCM10212_003610, partial [Sporobolomyces blumeae]
MTTSSRHSTASWLGSLAHAATSSSASSASAAKGLNSKYSTVALGAAPGSRRTRTALGIFEDGAATEPVDRVGKAGGLEEGLRDLQGLGSKEVDAAWSVTLAEGPKARSRNRK